MGGNLSGVEKPTEGDLLWVEGAFLLEKEWKESWKEIP